jgi:hypothetical protein
MPKFQPPVSKESSFLNAIRRGSVLKKVDMDAINAAKKKEDEAVTAGGLFSNDAVASILARRKNIELEDSDSDSDEDDDW